MKVLDLLLYVFIFSMLIISIFAYFMLKSEGSKCVSNPLVYGVNAFEKKLDETMLCTCSVLDSRYLPFIVTNNGSQPILPKNDYINFTNINMTFEAF